MYEKSEPSARSPASGCHLDGPIHAYSAVRTHNTVGLLLRAIRVGRCRPVFRSEWVFDFRTSLF